MQGHMASPFSHSTSFKTTAIHYSMEGSALQGTMIGGAMPAEVCVNAEADAPDGLVARLVRLAERSSPAHALMRDVLSNTFALTFNQRRLPVTDVAPSPRPPQGDINALFAAARPDGAAPFRSEIITKLRAAETVFGVEGGAGSSLQAEQRRTLHVHGEARLMDGMLMEASIQLIRPIGSTFRFLCDETRAVGGEESAPPPLAYLSAGIGFCYMTQLGRYAHITKQNLKSYHIVQDNGFTLLGALEDETRLARALPVDTHVYLEADEPEHVAQKTLSMGERTCFLHAAMRGAHPTVLRATLNGKELAIPDHV